MSTLLWLPLGFTILPSHSRIIGIGDARVILARALRTNPVRELRIGMLRDVAFHLVPIAAVIADLLASGANGDQAAQGLNAAQGLRQLGVGLLQRAGALPDEPFKAFQLTLGLVVQAPFLRQRAGQLQDFHRLERLLKNHQPVRVTQLPHPPIIFGSETGPALRSIEDGKLRVDSYCQPGVASIRPISTAAAFF